MTTTLPALKRGTTAEIDRCVDELVRGHERFAKAGPVELIRLAEACIEGTMRAASDWIETAARYKGPATGNSLRAEDMMTGPVATVRHLRLIIQGLRDIESSGLPQLLGKPRVDSDGRVRVPVFPARGLFDSVVFQGFRVEAWMQKGVTVDSIRQCPHGVPGGWRSGEPAVCLVLGAGNVSSIPTTDAFTKLFQEGRTVLLKMNPVNESLGPIFERAYAPLIEAGYLRIIYGGADMGQAAIQHPRIDEVHITGSIHSHDAIVWGPPGPERERRKRENDPLLKKPITSELGNVTPWVVVPGHYSRRQLDFQAENLASSITNNCSFNCIATKMIVTHAGWPERDRFLDQLQSVLDRVPLRRAYYPGAKERFERYSGRPAASGDLLPWTLVRGVTPQSHPYLFREESFVCVCAETAIAADDSDQFLDRAVDFVNRECWGTLACSLTVPPEFNDESTLRGPLKRLEYGTIAINQWSGLAFAMMSPGWGGIAGRKLDDAQSGIGWVHNTSLLDGVEKNVLYGPLMISPKPMWFPTHRNPEAVSSRLLELYYRPNVWNLARLLGAAVRYGR